MAVVIKNKAAYAKMMRTTDLFANKATSLYNLGKMKEGKKFETKGDKYYADNYNKIFKIMK